MHWLTVEVFDGGVPAAGWARAWHDRLIEAAVTGGAVFWDEHEHSWGVVLEFVFGDESRRDGFRQAPVLLAALDAVPDPVHGVLVYPHRGGGTGIRQPRRPRPVRDSGAAELPLPDPDDDRVVPCTAAAADAAPVRREGPASCARGSSRDAGWN
ncbi:hypothetical protein [Blastococcus deserti]|uniref:Antibiotic biosynthesis monooxygenase n=1 Tax=Blastococcus deserti TaxID=2259033 RepID=A0ABW4XBI1_9ACTN